MQSFPCLNNIIGLTRTTAEVYTENLGASPEAGWYTKSESGLYLDELPGIPSIKTLEQSLEDMTELPKWYQEAIETAKTELSDALMIGIATRFRQAHKNYIGDAGGKAYSADNPLSGTYGGLCIRTNGMRGGRLKIKGIYGVFQTPPTSISIYRIERQSQVMELVETIAVTFTANTLSLHTLPTAKSFDLDGYDYALVYSNAGVVPKNNLTACGCGSSETQMKRYINLVGINGTDLNQLNTWAQTGNGNGLALNIETGCFADNVLCELYESADVMVRVIAHCIQFKAGELVVERVQNSDRINRSVMIDREYYWGKRNHFRKEFSDRVAWIVETVDMTSFTDCFTCNQGGSKKVAKSSILS
jgi:hypothetical protein